ncbi:MAG: hypothetical protein ABID09_01540 [Candidatus Omnitrophota bacterium]
MKLIVAIMALLLMTSLAFSADDGDKIAVEADRIALDLLSLHDYVYYAENNAEQAFFAESLEEAKEYAGKAMLAAGQAKNLSRKIKVAAEELGRECRRR